MQRPNNHQPSDGVRTEDLVLVQSSLNPDPCDRNWWIGWISGNPDQFNKIYGKRALKVINTENSEASYVCVEHATRLRLAGTEQCKVIPLINIH